MKGIFDKKGSRVHTRVTINILKKPFVMTIFGPYDIIKINI